MSWRHFRDTSRTAHQAHKCWLCRRVIDAGEKYIERNGVNDREIVVMRMHTACERESHDWDVDDWEHTSEGDLRQYMEEKEAVEAARKEAGS